MQTTESKNKILFQLSGPALILGGVIGGIGQYLQPGDPQYPADRDCRTHLSALIQM